ncbi:MAG: hypothetical protein D6780_06910, partial [Candidatus Dadabacteria bacterium]
IVLLIIVGTIITALIVMNLQPITVQLWPGKKTELISGVAFLLFFVSGFAVSLLLLIFFGIRAWFREKALLSKERKAHRFLQLLLKARGLAAVGAYKEAKKTWEELELIDPTQVLSTVEMALCLLKEGDAQRALKILDRARSVAPNNLEVLHTAALLNAKLGNKTAAIDNLALLLYQCETPQLLQMARDYSEEVGRIDDALEYHKRILEISSLSQEEREEFIEKEARLKIKKLKSSSLSKEELTANLTKLLKEYPDSPAVYCELAETLENPDKLKKIAEQSIKAGQRRKEPTFFFLAATAWQKLNEPNRALAALRVAKEYLKEEQIKDIILAIVETSVKEGLINEALQELKNYFTAYPVQASDFLAADSLAISTREKLILYYLYLLHLKGEYSVEEKIWRTILEGNSEESTSTKIKSAKQTPNPVLSTP